MKPVRSIVAGTVVISLSMIIKTAPLLVGAGPRVSVADLLPLGSLFVVLTVALVALGAGEKRRQ
ncbi:MAG: hypothetical protein MUF54_15270 [Polyangiaceae bacterium]|nr:hypothetical protein [Polyangiaceae bacterium]